MLSQGMSAALALRRVDDASRYGSVFVEGDRVSQFMEKVPSGPGCINAGVYVLTRAALDHLPQGYSSIERDLFPLLAARNALVARSYSGFFIDIGLPETFESADSSIPVWQHKPCVFFDVETVSDMNAHGANDLYPFRWAKDAFQAIKWCNDSGYLVMAFFQPSDAVGHNIDDNALPDLVNRMQEDLRRYAAHFDAVYYCLRHPAVGGTRYLCSFDRRDGFGAMVRKAKKDWDIDVSRSVLVGTRSSDLDAGKCHGMPGFLYDGGSLLTYIQRLMRRLE
jgi:D-glycero-D-manno-heptose 1,7-bisphosphate phosphatase